MNEKIIQQFTELLDRIQAIYLLSILDKDKNQQKINSYRYAASKKILNVLQKIPYEIESSEQLKGISDIGKNTLRRIDEILETGELSELKKDYPKEKVKQILEMLDVINIGTAKMKDFISQGITSVKELKQAVKENKIKVSKPVELGLKYYGIIKKNIPRSEIDLVKEMLYKACEDFSFEIIICGSYRRQRATSNDIDVLVYDTTIQTKKDIPKKSPLEILVTKLKENNFLLDSMTTKNYLKYLGFCQLPGYPVRRIDLLFVPYESLGTALCYYTGPYQLNTIMRSEAKRRGMILNEHNIQVLDRSIGDLYELYFSSEAEVFQQVNMSYLTPKERDAFCDDVKNHPKKV